MLAVKPILDFLAPVLGLVFSSCVVEMATQQASEGHTASNTIHIRGLEAHAVEVAPGQGPPPRPASLPQVRLTLIREETGAVERVLALEDSLHTRLEGVPDGTYLVMAEVGGGFRPPPPQKVVVAQGQFGNLELVFERIAEDHFFYRWESDGQGRETEFSANANVSPRIEVLGQNIEMPQTTAALTLRRDYNIVLDDGEVPWSYDVAAKLLRAVHSIPHTRIEHPARFTLTGKHLADDISFRLENGAWRVSLSAQAFAYASKKLVKLNGQKGFFFSRRLFQALVHFFTEGGANGQAVAKILQEKFALTTRVGDYQRLTGESRHNFQAFHHRELVALIHALSEMPLGLYKIKGLRYLVRRLDGHPHPRYPAAAAVAWPRGADDDSYIEFMDTAFLSGSEDSTHRLILHEKAHFLWGNLFSKKLKEDWIKLGNWVRNSRAASGWSTTDNTQFASPYAHDMNPNEDMAETLAHYILNPNKLLSVASKKFDFVERRIMNGYRYVSQIREDLTFEVFNLFPDYDYPGKIRAVEVRAEGDAGSDKRVRISIELSHRKGLKDGAQRAYMRVTSPDETFKDLYLEPVGGNAHLLAGEMTIPKTASSGYWNTQNITITDRVGNQRMEGVIDFGFKLYINNADPDTSPPQYVANSLNIGVREDVDSRGRRLFKVGVRWKVAEDGQMKREHPAYAALISPDHPNLYRLEEYGGYHRANREAQVDFVLTDFFPPGSYGVSFLTMQDMALNIGQKYFSDDPKHEPISTVTIESDDPDTAKPQLDVNRISIQASPLNSATPDGRTNVDITFYARDDKSGLGVVHYQLADPLGKAHFKYFVHSNFHTRFFAGDPMAWRKYQIKATLPKGSPPGRWGLLEMVLKDKVGNVGTYNFLETLHFEVE